MKLKICFLGLLCLFFRASGQEKTAFSGLKTGDKMPDVLITNIQNSRMKSAKISDYKGKLIILDFWSTWCSACIESFPEMDSLQRKFAGDLQVFLVDAKREGDTERGVRMVVNRANEWSAKSFKVPVVFPDTALTSHFVFHSLPHCVWIGKDGTIIGITDKAEVTAENIAKIIAGQPVKLTPKIR
jgi:thiol-disulfide isomerase/thioredoxin